MRYGAVAVALVIAAASGCDLVFQPSGHAIDAPTSPMADADPFAPDADPNAPDATSDGPVGPADGRVASDGAGPADSAPACMVCYDMAGNTGAAPCASPVVDHCPGGVADYIDAIDLCTCSLGEPALFLFEATVPGSAHAVMLTTDPISNNALFWTDGSNQQCVHQAGDSCDADACALGPRSIRIWEGVPLSTGVNHFETHAGGTCVGPPTHVFDLVLP